MEYMVKTYKEYTNKLQEEIFTTYKEALYYALESKDTNLYRVIVILKHDTFNNDYFLHRIIK